MPASRAIISHIEKFNLSHKTAYMSHQLKKKTADTHKTDTDVKTQSATQEQRELPVIETKAAIVESMSKTQELLSKKNQNKKKSKETAERYPETQAQTVTAEKEIVSEQPTEVTINSGIA